MQTGDLRHRSPSPLIVPHELLTFWVRAQAHGHRASRLDSAQHDMSSTASARRSSCGAPAARDLRARVQRLVVATSDASLLSVKQACALLGLPSDGGGGLSRRRDLEEEEGLQVGGVSRSTQAAELAVMGLSAVDAATHGAIGALPTCRRRCWHTTLAATTRRQPVRRAVRAPAHRARRGAGRGDERGRGAPAARAPQPPLRVQRVPAHRQRVRRRHGQERALQRARLGEHAHIDGDVRRAQGRCVSAPRRCCAPPSRSRPRRRRSRPR